MSGSAHDGPGYTGHVMDASTGLTYMQQRYYDPDAMRFLSMDPVEANGTDGSNLGRYWYANDNPYRYTDPDGRCIEDACIGEAMAVGAAIGAVVNIGAQVANGHGSFKERVSSINWKQVGVAAGAGALGGGAGAVASTATTTAGMIGANAIAGTAIGAVGVHASAAVDGKTASTGDVIKGAAVGGVLSAAASGVAAVPSMARGAASASMSQTEKVAAGNLVQGVVKTTESAGGRVDLRPAGQGAANAAAEVISNSDNLKAQPKSCTRPGSC